MKIHPTASARLTSFSRAALVALSMFASTGIGQAAEAAANQLLDAEQVLDQLTGAEAAPELQLTVFKKLLEEKKLTGITPNTLKRVVALAPAGQSDPSLIIALLHETQAPAQTVTATNSATTETTPAPPSTRTQTPKPDTAANSASTTTPNSDPDTEERNPPSGEVAPLPHYSAFVHGGVRLLSPYKFNETTRTLESGDSKATGFVEFVFSNRTVWSPDRLEALRPRKKSTKAAHPAETDQTVEPTQHESDRFSRGILFPIPDIETRFNINTGAGEAEANAVVGSGDFGLEISLGLPWYVSQGPGYAWSIGPEISYGVITEKENFNARERGFIGPSYTGSFALDKERRLLWQTRGGYTLIDSLQFVDRNTREIETDFGGRPKYSSEDAWVIETNVIYPINKDTFLTFGASVYSGVTPNTWTAYIGYSRSITDVFGGLFGKGGQKTSESQSQPAQRATGSDATASGKTQSESSWTVPKL